MPNDSERKPGEEKTERRRKPGRYFGLIPLALAILPFMNSLDNPRVAMLHVPDIMRLIAVGLLLGVGFSIFMFGGE